MTDYVHLSGVIVLDNGQLPSQLLVREACGEGNLWLSEGGQTSGYWGVRLGNDFIWAGYIDTGDLK